MYSMLLEAFEISSINSHKSTRKVLPAIFPHSPSELMHVIGIALRCVVVWWDWI